MSIVHVNISPSYNTIQEERLTLYTQCERLHCLLETTQSETVTLLWKNNNKTTLCLLVCKIFKVIVSLKANSFVKRRDIKLESVWLPCIINHFLLVCLLTFPHLTHWLNNLPSVFGSLFRKQNLLVITQPECVQYFMVMLVHSSSHLEIIQGIHVVLLLKVQETSVDQHFQFQCVSQ